MGILTLRRSLVALFAATVAFGAITVQADTVRIGYQKYGTLTLLKSSGALEKRLAEQGVEVKWTEFPAGPQLLRRARRFSCPRARRSRLLPSSRARRSR